MRHVVVAVSLIVGSGFSPTSIAPPEGGPHDQTLERFLADLQAASDRDDRRAIAAMVHYPIRVLAGGWVLPIKDRATFVQSFPAFFSEEIKDLIAEAAAKPRSGKLPDVIVLGKDAVRIMRINGPFKIIGITVPSSSGRVRGARRGTTLVSFPKGESTGHYAGTLASGEHESYVVTVGRNELLDVRIEGVHGRDIVARIVDAATKTPLDARARDGARVWAGRVPASGDYRIDIVRTAPTGDAVLTYALTVSVR